MVHFYLISWILLGNDRVVFRHLEHTREAARLDVFKTDRNKCYKLKQTHLDKKKMNPKTRPLQLPGVDPFMVDIVNVLCLVPANQNSFLNVSPFFSKFIAKQYFHLLRTSGIWWNTSQTTYCNLFLSVIVRRVLTIERL